MNANDHGLVARYKSLLWTDEQIAAKMGITKERVAVIWKEVTQTAQDIEINGFANLCQQYHILCHQYQLLGESLKILARALSASVTGSSIQEMVPGITEEQGALICSKFIVLPPFIPVNPADSLAESLRQQQRGN